MPDHVEINYDQMAHIAQACDQQGEEARQMLQAISNQVENLRAGGWMGQGANAFFGEMDDLVLPALNRLLAALQQAADVVRAIAYQFSEAEQDTARLLSPQGTAASENPLESVSFDFGKMPGTSGGSQEVYPKVEGMFPKVEDGGGVGVGGSQSQKVYGGPDSVGGSSAQKVGGNQDFKVEGNQAQQVGGNQSFKVESNPASAQVSKFPGPPGGGGGGSSPSQNVVDVSKFPETPTPSGSGDPGSFKFSQGSKFAGLDDDVDDLSHKV